MEIRFECGTLDQEWWIDMFPQYNDAGEFISHIIEDISYQIDRDFGTPEIVYENTMSGGDPDIVVRRIAKIAFAEPQKGRAIIRLVAE